MKKIVVKKICSVRKCQNEAKTCVKLNLFDKQPPQKSTINVRLHAIKQKKPLCKKIKSLNKNQFLFEICRNHNINDLKLKQLNDSKSLVLLDESLDDKKFQSYFSKKLLEDFIKLSLTTILFDRTSDYCFRIPSDDQYANIANKLILNLTKSIIYLLISQTYNKMMRPKSKKSSKNWKEYVWQYVRHPIDKSKEKILQYKPDLVRLIQKLFFNLNKNFFKSVSQFIFRQLESECLLFLKILSESFYESWKFLKLDKAIQQAGERKTFLIYVVSYTIVKLFLSAYGTALISNMMPNFDSKKEAINFLVLNEQDIAQQIVKNMVSHVNTTPLNAGISNQQKLRRLKNQMRRRKVDSKWAKKIFNFLVLEFTQ